MKRFKKILLALLLPVLVLQLASCKMSQANLYNKWKSGSTENLPKAHVFEEISVGDLIGKVQKQGSEDKLYVFFGSTTSSQSQAAIKIYNQQAIQYEINKVYWVNSNLSDGDKKKLSADEGGILRVNDPEYLPAIYVFEGGVLKFDSSEAKYKNDTTKYTTVKLAEIAFKGLYNEN